MTYLQKLFYRTQMPMEIPWKFFITSSQLNLKQILVLLHQL